MTTALDPIVAYAVQGPRPGLKDRLRDWIPRLVLAPSFLLIIIFVYGFNLWTLLLSFTNSKAFTNLSGRYRQRARRAACNSAGSPRRGRSRRAGVRHRTARSKASCAAA